ncbi:MAG: hypothetical protein R3B07_28480 [Polyangiaceae bacterium]
MRQPGVRAQHDYLRAAGNYQDRACPPWISGTQASASHVGDRLRTLSQDGGLSVLDVASGDAKLPAASRPAVVCPADTIRGSLVVAAFADFQPLGADESGEVSCFDESSAHD